MLRNGLFGVWIPQIIWYEVGLERQVRLGLKPSSYVYIYLFIYVCIFDQYRLPQINLQNIITKLFPYLWL